ncbi:hypothetical protein [Synechococcus sp. CC9311]|uniref:hypothetical protein n=1 Tax=Synechococcus sp. (strain CC9311) TaxID=64471 RepID=UPI0011D0A67A|nr:hypothetical protein [Synechococcus sp. CC9311]
MIKPACWPATLFSFTSSLLITKTEEKSWIDAVTALKQHPPGSLLPLTSCILKDLDYTINALHKINLVLKILEQMKSSRS